MRVMTTRDTLSIRWAARVGLVLLLLSGCTDSTKKCTSLQDCPFGTVCHEGRCVDRSRVPEQFGEDLPTVQELLKKEATLQATTEQCAASDGCINRGKCQGTPSGGCIVAEQAHCENSEVTCTQEGKCVYVPAKYSCCESAMGSVCERP